MTFEIRAFAVALALALQVQVTLPIDAAGLGPALSDLLLPVLVPFFAWLMIRLSRHFEWRVPGTAWWLVAITGVMSLALVIGYLRQGHWSSWALLNKWCGWLILVAYFLVGGAIVRTGGVALRSLFLKAFLISLAIVAGANVLAMPWLLPHYTLPIGIEFGRATGAMRNANAFGFLACVGVLILLATNVEKGSALHLVPILSALWFTSSRGAALALLAGIVSLLALKRRGLKPVARMIALALPVIAIVTAASVAVDPMRRDQARSGDMAVGFLSSNRFDPNAFTVAERRGQHEQAVDLFLDAPMLGQGLGFFVDATGRTLHNSFLWLVLELGVIGTVAVVGFLLLAVRALYLGRADSFVLGMVPVSIAFMIMSLTGEYLYQRHLWVLLGMALAVPPAAQRSQ